MTPELSTGPEPAIAAPAVAPPAARANAAPAPTRIVAERLTVNLPSTRTVVRLHGTDARKAAAPGKGGNPHSLARRNDDELARERRVPQSLQLNGAIDGY